MVQDSGILPTMSKLKRRGGDPFDGSNRRLPPATSTPQPTSPYPESFEAQDFYRGTGPGPVSAPPGVARKPLSGRAPPLKGAFYDPGLKKLPLDPRTRVCLQRKKRREILFALKRSGPNKRHGAGGTYRRSINSKFSC